MYVSIEKVVIIRHKYRGLYLQKFFWKNIRDLLVFYGPYIPTYSLIVHFLIIFL